MDTMGIRRITTVSAQMGIPRMAELRAMAQIMCFSPTRPMAHLVIRMAAPVFSSTVPMVQPKKITMATLLMVLEKPLLMVPSMSCQGVPRAMARINADRRIPMAALTLHLEISTIIKTITRANTISTYDVDISQTPFCIFQISMLKSNLYAKRIVLRRFSFCVSIFLVCPAWSFHAVFPFYVHIQ